MNAKKIASQISSRVDNRFGDLQNPVESVSAHWNPMDVVADLPLYNRGLLRVFLFHLAAVLDINEFEMECRQCYDDKKVE